MRRKLSLSPDLYLELRKLLQRTANGGYSKQYPITGEGKKALHSKLDTVIADIDIMLRKHGYKQSIFKRLRRK